MNHIASLYFWATFVQTKVQFSIQVSKIRTICSEPVKKYLRNVLSQNMGTFHLWTWGLDRHIYPLLPGISLAILRGHNKFWQDKLSFAVRAGPAEVMGEARRPGFYIKPQHDN